MLIVGGLRRSATAAARGIERVERVGTALELLDSTDLCGLGRVGEEGELPLFCVTSLGRDGRASAPARFCCCWASSCGFWRWVDVMLLLLLLLLLIAAASLAWLRGWLLWCESWRAVVEVEEVGSAIYLLSSPELLFLVVLLFWW